MNEYLAFLFASQVQTHVFHLATTSYAKHKALNEYYDEIEGLVDVIAETYQGKYDILDMGFKASIKSLKSDEEIVPYFEKLLKYTQSKRKDLPQDGMLTNHYDEVDGLISSTLYKLKQLS